MRDARIDKSEKDLEKNIEGFYSLITFLPCKIHLPNNQIFPMNILGVDYHFMIQDRKRATTILDMHNDFLASDGSFSYKGFQVADTPPLVIDTIYNDYFMVLGNQPGNAIYYTPITVIITDFETSLSNETVETARKALSEFIREYQMVSRDMLAFTPDELFTQPVIDFGYYHSYTPEQIILKPEERLQIDFLREYIPVNINMKAYNIKQSGFDGKEQEFADKLLMSLNPKKKDEFILYSLHQAEVQIYPLRNYKAAFLNCFFVIETVIQDYVYEKKISKGVSKTKLDQLKKDISLSYMINVELPILMPDYNNDHKDFFGKINSFRSLRNDLVHNRGTITEKQAKEAKTVTFKLLHVLNIIVLSSQISPEQLKNISPKVSYSIID